MIPPRRQAEIGGRRSESDDLDPGLEAPEIAAIGGQQAGLAVGQHGRDDVGVVHLAAAEHHLRHSSARRAPTSGPSSSTSNAAAKRSTSARASAIAIGSLPPPGLVTTARYSRITCRLSTSRRSRLAAFASAAMARRWNELEGRVE
jgi:hypothetical protein